MKDHTLRNCYATLFVGFVVGELLVLAGLPDPIPAIAVFGTWFAIPATALYVVVKGL